MKITELNKDQESKLTAYRELANKVGLATGADFDEALIRDLTDKHRVLCGKEKATIFEIYDSPFAALEKYPKYLSTSNALFGQHDANWLYTYLFFRVECNLVEETNQIVHLLELTKYVGWMWMSSDTTIVTRRPTKLHLIPKANGLQVCHNPDGKAIEYKDGTGVYIIDGLRIPNEFVHLIYSKNPNDIMKVSNTEVRSALIKSLGVDKMFELLPSVTVHEGTTVRGGHYKLMKIEIDGNTRVYLTGVCPSKGNRWYEAVPPDVTTIEQANEWREWGTMNRGYLPPSVRT